MKLDVSFSDITIDDVLALSRDKKAAGYRYVQMLCVNCEDGLDVQYTFGKGNALENYTIHGVTKDDVIPSITDDWFSAFVFENEAHDLFGVNIKGIVIDFEGNFYAVSQKEPMTIISPEVKAARDKARKLAAAKAAKAAKAAEGAGETNGKSETDEEKAARRAAALEKAKQIKAARAAAKAAEEAAGEPAPTGKDGE